MWIVEFYKTKNNKNPVRDFIKKQGEKEIAKFIKEFELLEEKGIYLGFPFTSKIKGDDYKYLWELRIKFSSNNFRVIYFLYIKNVFVLLHAFKKKTPKIQKKELDTAKNRMIDYLKRKGE